MQKLGPGQSPSEDPEHMISEDLHMTGHGNGHFWFGAEMMNI
jgi:hypothetical protein